MVKDLKFAEEIIRTMFAERTPGADLDITLTVLRLGNLIMAIRGQTLSWAFDKGMEYALKGGVIPIPVATTVELIEQMQLQLDKESLGLTIEHLTPQPLRTKEEKRKMN